MQEVALIKAAEKLTPIIDDVYTESKGRLKTQLAKFKNHRKLNELYKEINSVLKVKTIWQTDKRVNLKKFYYPAKIKSLGKNVSSISKISTDENLLIQGTVGQGKSMFMRYMTAQEMAQGNRIPIFFELRYIEKNKTLTSHLINCLNSLNFDCDTKLFDIYAKTGKFVFFLDGFDETPSSIRNKLIRELDNLSQKYPKTQIVVSSRPDNGIEFSHSFDVEHLCPLDESDIPQLIEKLSESKEQSEYINSAIKENGSKISPLLTTPLMVTLLIIAYKAEQKIPQNFTDFYESLFSTLLSKHDKTKPGYYRERKCTLNDRELEEAFEAFCFSTRKNQKSSLTRKEANRLAVESKSLSGLKFDDQAFIEDILKITCLLTEEGGRYYFIHKSIQEFFAACFIERLPDTASSKFYEQLKSGLWNSWRQELSFLSEIDRYNYCKNFMIPLYENEVAYFEDNKGKYNQKQAENLLSRFEIEYKKNLDHSDIFFMDSDFHNNYPLSKNPKALIYILVPVQFLLEDGRHLRTEDHKEIKKSIEEKYEFAVSLVHKIKHDNPDKNISVLDFLTYCGKSERGLELIYEHYKTCKKELENAISLVNRIDNIPSLISL